MLRATVLLLLLVASVTTAGTANEDGDVVTIETRQGSLKGLIQQAGSTRNYFSFRGIPYAMPPVGDLRFKVGGIKLCYFYLRRGSQPKLYYTGCFLLFSVLLKDDYQLITISS